jgi:protein-tyrosine phosphatase
VNSFALVFVCTGNRFRSPLAEAFVRRLTLGLPVAVESFGILDVSGSSVLTEALELGHWSGIDLSHHRARQLGAESLAHADLVLGFEPSHVRHAVVDADAPRDRSFTFRDFDSLLETTSAPASDDVVTRAREIVEAAAGRGELPQESIRSSITDPYGRSWQVYRETAEEIRTLSITLAESLFGVSDVRGLPPFPRKLRRRRKYFWR